MSLDLVQYENKAHNAILRFWKSRDDAGKKQLASGNIDQGERSSVTSGKSMDGFVSLVTEIVLANGLAHAEIHLERAALTLPGYFRPTKLWDLLVIHQEELIAAIELKSHVGPSFGNNFNNRAEESIGTAHDFWTAYREGAFGKQTRSFAGWLMLVEDAPKSRPPVKEKSPHFPVSAEFQNASYLKRYDVLCQRLVLEQLYSSAAVIASPRDAITNGKYSDISDMTSLKTFVSALAGHVATQASRLG